MTVRRGKGSKIRKFCKRHLSMAPFGKLNKPASVSPSGRHRRVVFSRYGVVANQNTKSGMLNNILIVSKYQCLAFPFDFRAECTWLFLLAWTDAAHFAIANGLNRREATSAFPWRSAFCQGTRIVFSSNRY